MASPASSTMHSSTRCRAYKGALCDTASLPGVRVDRNREPLCRIAESSESPSPSRGRILRLDVRAPLPRADSTAACDYPARVELAALCSFSEGCQGLDAAH